MTEKTKTTSRYAVRLLKPHTHAGKPFAAGEIIAADQLDPVTADWLIAHRIGVTAAYVATPPTATASKKE